jgi:putative polyhydroxyalkanoate system protein
MPNITITIPHQLTRAEAKRRMREGMGQSRQQFAGLLGPVEEHWDGDNLDLKITAAGQVITGRAVVGDQEVRVNIALPWVLAMLAGTVRRGIEQQGRQLLGHRSAGSPKS